MIKEFYEKLKTNFEKDNKKLDTNLFQIAVFELYNSTIFKNNNLLKLNLFKRTSNHKDTVIKMYKDGVNQNLILNIDTDSIIKDNVLDLDYEILNKKEKEDLLIFRSAFNENKFEDFLTEIKKLCLIEIIDNKETIQSPIFVFKNLKNLKVDIGPNLFDIFNTVINKDFELYDLKRYFNISFKDFIAYNNNDPKLDKSEIIANCSRILDINFKYTSEENQMLTNDEVINVFKNNNSPLLKILFKSKTNEELYKNIFEGIIIPKIREELETSFDYKIKKVESYEEYLENNPLILETINEMKKDFPYFFNYDDNNLYEEFLTADEYKNFHRLKSNYSEVQKEYENIFKPSLGIYQECKQSSTENEFFLRYSNESYEVLFLNYSHKKYEYGKSIFHVNGLVYNDIEKTLESNKKHLKESLRKFFDYAYSMNAAIHIESKLSSEIYGKYEKEDSERSYINKCFDEIKEEYKNKVICISKNKESYLLDVIHSSDLKMNDIISNIDYLNSFSGDKFMTSQKFDDIISGLKQNMKVHKSKF